MELETLKLPLRLRHEPRHLGDAIEQQTLADLKSRLKSLSQADERHKTCFELPNGTHVPNLGDPSYFRFLKRRRTHTNVLTAREAIVRLDPPPQEPSDLLPCAELPDLYKLPLTADVLSIPAGVDMSRCRPRIGRGGRLLFDRADAVTGDPLAPGQGFAGPEAGGGPPAGPWLPLPAPPVLREMVDRIRVQPAPPAPGMQPQPSLPVGGAPAGAALPAGGAARAGVNLTIHLPLRKGIP